MRGAFPARVNLRNGCPAAFDLVFPGLLDQCHDAVRHRDVIEVGRHLLAVLIAPIEELQGRRGIGRIGRDRLHQDEGRAGNRPGFVARRIGQDYVEVRRAGPIGAGSGGLERLHRRSNGLARSVDHLGIGQVVLLGISIFDITERTDGLRRIIGDAFAALGADADRPLDRGVGADFGTPIRAHLGQIVGPDEGGARTVGAVHDGDGGVRQADAGIELGDRRIVPLGDLAEEDLGNGRSVERHFARFDAGQVEDRNHGAVDHRKLHEAILGDVFRRHRLVAGAEGDGLGDDLLDAAARADRLIIQPDAGVFPVLHPPIWRARDTRRWSRRR